MKRPMIDVLAITRPSRRLLAYYVLRAVLFPLRLVILPYDFFRYETMRYRFDPEGVTMSWGVLFRHQINLAYSRIQDVHLTSSLLQRWLGLADLHIETAAGSTHATMKLEGIDDVTGLRDFLYATMRDARGAIKRDAQPEMQALLSGLADVTTELRRTREALEHIAEAAKR
jgi:uncharacterized protein